MENQWKIQIWGVRGSAPAPAKEFLRYGGNTTCVSVACGSKLIIFDAGSGLTALGDILEKEGKCRRVDLFLSHMHLDHLLGFFTFRPFYCPEMEIHIYGQAKKEASPQKTSQGSGQNPAPKDELTARLGQLLGPPYWPIGLSDFKAKVFIHPLVPGKAVRLWGQEGEKNERITLYTLPGNHPGGSLLYRMEGAGNSLVYGLDCEMDETIAPAYLDFARHANLLLWDATFTQNDWKKGWGHSTWEQGLAVRRQAGADRILMLHYANGYTDDFLSQQEEQARQQDPSCCFAKEGMTIFLPQIAAACPGTSDTPGKIPAQPAAACPSTPDKIPAQIQNAAFEQTTKKEW